MSSQTRQHAQHQLAPRDWALHAAPRGDRRLNAADRFARYGDDGKAARRRCVLFGRLVLIALVTGGGCRANPPATSDETHAETTAAKADAPGQAHRDDEDAGGERQLRLDADTLRDLRITIAAVETRTTTDTLTLLGELGVNQDAYAEVSAPISARVTRLLASPGDAVRAGQALVLLQSREIGEALGAWQSAAARVTLARQALERRRTLAAERITPQRSVEEAAAELAAAEAAERAARTTLDALGVPTTGSDGNNQPAGRDSARGAADVEAANRGAVMPNVPAGTAPVRDESADAARRGDAPAEPRGATARGRDVAPTAPPAPGGLALRSPVSGTVLERNVALGQLADPAKPLFRIADLRTLWLIVHAFERDAVRLAPGASARVALAALPGESFGGTIARIGQQVDPASRTVDVRIDLPNPRGRLKPGMSASAAVPIGTQGRPVLTVPAAALQRLGERWCVFIPAPASEGAGRFQIRAVARGRDLDGEVEVLDGLAATDRVVSDGAFVLKAEVDKRAGAGDAHAH